MLGKIRIEISVVIPLIFFMTANLQADRVYVDLAATNGLQNGADWINAYTDLEDALEYARNNSSIDEIWVAKGEYYPSEPATAYWTPTFTLVSDVAVYGGFFR